VNYKHLLDLAIKVGQLSCDGDHVVSEYAPATLECDNQDLYQYILMGAPPVGEVADSEVYWGQFPTSNPRISLAIAPIANAPKDQRFLACMRSGAVEWVVWDGAHWGYAVGRETYISNDDQPEYYLPNGFPNVYGGDSE
jgi:hypothetical protein